MAAVGLGGAPGGVAAALQAERQALAGAQQVADRARAVLLRAIFGRLVALHSPRWGALKPRSSVAQKYAAWGSTVQEFEHEQAACLDELQQWKAWPKGARRGVGHVRNAVETTSRRLAE